MFLTQPSLGLPTSTTVRRVSTTIDCLQMGRVCFQVTTADPGTSAAHIEVSNDGTYWVDVGTPTALIAGTIMIEKVDLTQRYCRLNLAVTSGTVTGLLAIFNGKL